MTPDDLHNWPDNWTTHFTDGSPADLNELQMHLIEGTLELEVRCNGKRVGQMILWRNQQGDPQLS
jgi:hypothetical protein